MVRKREDRCWDVHRTFATMALKNGMDIKNLSAMLGHVSAATTLDIYTDMLSEAAAKIDRSLGEEVAEDTSKTVQNPLTDFQPVMMRTRKTGILGASPNSITTSSKGMTRPPGRTEQITVPLPRVRR